MSIMVILSMYKRWSIYLMSSTHHTNYYPLTHHGIHLLYLRKPRNLSHRKMAQKNGRIIVGKFVKITLSAYMLRGNMQWCLECLRKKNARPQLLLVVRNMEDFLQYLTKKENWGCFHCYLIYQMIIGIVLVDITTISTTTTDGRTTDGRIISKHCTLELR